MHITKLGIITGIDRQLAGFAGHLAREVPERPLWQRIVLPLCGLALMVIGIAATFTPVPLSVLAVIGWPLLLCFDPRVEAWGRKWMFRHVDALRRWLLDRR